jgi:vacuolar protein sorting-associated protein 45
MKALVVDQDTLSTVSLVISQSEVLQKDVFLIETIEKLEIPRGSDRLSHLKGLLIIRPSPENISILKRALDYPKYEKFFIYFTNKTSESTLKELAEADRSEVISSVIEIFSDITPLNHDLFTLNIPNVVSLSSEGVWGDKERSLLNKLSERVFASLLTMRKFPVIRYQKSSKRCQELAFQVHQLLREDPDLMTSYAGRSTTGHKNTIDNVDQSSVLLIVDRREDPVTPLLHQWTYQAMLHELLGIENNKVQLKQYSGPDREVPLTCVQDEFFKEFMFANFGDLAQGVKDLVNEFHNNQKFGQDVESIEDMKKFVKDYPEFSRVAGNVSKHVSLTSEIDLKIKKRILLDVSEIEQDIACNENKNEQFRKINEILKDGRYNQMDKLKLVILFGLRYEGDPKSAQLLNGLRDSGVKESELDLLEAVLKYAGGSKRSCDLFHNKNLIARARYNFKMVMKDVPNVFIQHQSYLSTVIDQVVNKRLKENEFPATAPFNSRENLSTLFVFVVGGTTYEEAKEVAMINRAGGETTVLLGSNFVHNSVSFLAEVSQLNLR